jgi:hypothetical protein
VIWVSLKDAPERLISNVSKALDNRRSDGDSLDNVQYRKSPAKQADIENISRIETAPHSLTYYVIGGRQAEAATAFSTVSRWLSASAFFRVENCLGNVFKLWDEQY